MTSTRASRLVRRLSDRVARWLHRDPLTFARIVPRDDLTRIGTDYGGWVVPITVFDAGSICYCVGCGEDISFDLGLMERFGCHVFAFDPTPRAIAHVAERAGRNPNYHFSPVGLWDEPGVLKFYAPKNPEHVSHSLLNLQKTDHYIDVRVERLRRVMADNGHERLDLLKLDVEGAEYKVIDAMLEDRLDVRVLCVEYDECFNPLDGEYRRRIRASAAKLRRAGYALVCARGYGNYTFVKQG